MKEELGKEDELKCKRLLGKLKKQVTFMFNGQAKDLEKA